MQSVLLLLTKKKTGDLQAPGGLPVGGGGGDQVCSWTTDFNQMVLAMLAPREAFLRAR